MPTFPVKYPARPSWGDEQCLQPRSRPTCFRVLVEGDDFDPVRALAGRVASNRLQRAGLGVDRVGRDRVRLLAGDDNEAAGRIDIETAGLLLGRRASEIGELSARGVGPAMSVDRGNWKWRFGAARPFLTRNGHLSLVPDHAKNGCGAPF